MSWLSNGLRADGRRAVGLEDCNAVLTPVTQTRAPEDDETDALTIDEAYCYRRCVGIGRHLVMYRPDIAFALRELGKSLSQPRAADMERLRRLARYLKSSPRLVQKFPNQERVHVLDGWCDANH